ncbi:TPA: hypothetical protein ACX96Z_000098 [Clostridium sporogenes]
MLTVDARYLAWDKYGCCCLCCKRSSNTAGKTAESCKDRFRLYGYLLKNARGYICSIWNKLSSK